MVERRLDCAGEQGLPLTVCYARREKYFSPVYRALIEAGVAGGLPDVLDEIAVHASQRAKIVERMRRALAYPLVAAAFVAVSGLALTLFVAPPQLGLGEVPIDEAAGRPFDWTAWSGVGIVGLIVALTTITALLRRPLDEGVGPQGLRYRIPLFGRLRTYASKASFAATLALLVRRSTPLPRALRLTAAATDDAEVRRRVERMADVAERGGGLPESLDAGRIISPSLAWFIESSTDQRGAAEALEDVASIYRQRLERAADRSAVLAAPIAQVLIGLVVLGFALSYLSSAFQMSQSIHS